MEFYYTKFEFLAIAVFAIAIILRTYLLAKYKWVGIDTFYHFVVARIIRNEKNIPESIDCFIVPEKYSYPPLLHIILSMFDTKKHQRLQYISPFADILSGLIIFLFCLNLFNLEVATFASALYLFTPITVDGSFSLGPRSLANLFFNASILSLSYYYFTGMNIAAYVSMLFSALLILTHRLTTQSLIFSMMAVSVGFHSLVPIYILISSVIISVIFTRGFYLRVLKGHIDFVKIFGKKLIHKESRKEMTSIFPKPINFFFNMPIFLLFMSTWMLPKSTIILKFFFVVSLSLTILSFIWIFGEGTRHMSNAISSFAILISVYLVNSSEYKFSILLVIICILISLFFTIYKIIRIEKMLNLGNITTNKMLEGFEYIRSQRKQGDIMLCLPLDITYNATYFTNCIMLQSSGGFAQGLSFNQKLRSKLENGDIKDIIKHYKVKWIYSMSKKCDIPDSNKVFENSDIVIYRQTN